MWSPKQLASTILLVLLALQIHQHVLGTDLVFARPVEANKTNPTLDDLLTQSETISRCGEEVKDPPIHSESVLQALSVLNSQQDIQPSQPVRIISHPGKDPVKQDSENDHSDKGPIQARNDQGPTNEEGAKHKSTEALESTLQALQVPRTRFCAQPDNTNHTMDEIAETLVKKERKRLAHIRQERLSSASANHIEFPFLTDADIIAEATKTVQVVWHVIHSGSTGNLSRATINAQMDSFSSDYKSFGFTFNLNATDRVNNAQWFRNVAPDNAQQTAMKAALRQGDAKVLNLYSVDFSNGLLGYSTFPWMVQNNLLDDGVVFQYSSVPGGSETGYNLGKTLTHEVGHWLGLYHVFQGGCSAPGDYVDDTPPQSIATSGCPTGQDSCRGGGVDSIHNYSTDACLTEFTEGQAVRMAALTAEYRGL
ncbi:Peptidase M43, pregnancy-associated plasma-A [Kalmanozyma brasiliensis GHG001]|uniref:Peptidase M43 pregnancy-associated plasma-A domain-containing protein n=1 Tax=Kalmanozyma brasiliensis (strain GHG001) TaxID=1365824 RepID=V5GVY6_KALBG|nr:Peptidase M43, pregnancy-associated plasma-A [Kalmanozyma brasiliensis GHG001]EST10027.1 Peptidase M43, pregnancy-associated plasma-A [Kalmanozyma brasiliensis GHG001]